MVNKRGRQKKCVKIFLNFTYLHKTQPGQKTAGNFPDFFEGIYSPDVWVSRFGCRFKYLAVSQKPISPRGGGYYAYFGYGNVPSGRVSIFTILV